MSTYRSNGAVVRTSARVPPPELQFPLVRRTGPLLRPSEALVVGRSRPPRLIIAAVVVEEGTRGDEIWRVEAFDEGLVDGAQRVVPVRSSPRGPPQAGQPRSGAQLGHASSDLPGDI